MNNAYILGLLIRIKLYYLFCLIHNIHKIGFPIISVTLFGMLSFSNFCTNFNIPSIINFLLFNSRLLYSVASIFNFLFLIFLFYSIFFCHFLIFLNSISLPISPFPKDIFFIIRNVSLLYNHANSSIFFAINSFNLVLAMSFTLSFSNNTLFSGVLLYFFFCYF